MYERLHEEEPRPHLVEVARHAEALSIDTTAILGVQISALNMPLAVETIERWVEQREKHYVCICTVHSVMEATSDPAYMRVLNNAGMATPDGMPLVWLSRKAGKDHVSRVAGPDLMPELLGRSAQTGHRHYFYGGGSGVADELVTRMTDRFPGLQVAGTHTPPMQKTGELAPQEVIDEINATKPDIVWVGLGAPKQDVWAANHLDLLDVPVIVAVGAAFDFHSGRIRRAPEWMQKRGLEWLYRLSQDPRRLWKRYLVTNGRFVTRLTTTKLRARTSARRQG